MGTKPRGPFADPKVRNEWQSTGKAGAKQRAKMERLRRPPFAKPAPKS